MLAGGPDAGAVIGQIIAVDPIEHPGVASRQGNRRQQAVQGALTGVAAVGGIGCVGRIRQFSRRDQPMQDAQPAGLLDRLLAQMRSQGRRHAGNRLGPLPQLLHGDCRHQSAVHPARISHHHRRLQANGMAQPLQSCFQLRGHSFQQTKRHGSVSRRAIERAIVSPAAGHQLWLAAGPKALAGTGQTC